MKSGEKLYSIILANLLKRERLIGINTLTNQQDMTRSELSKEIIPKISDYLFSKNFIDNATHDDAEDNAIVQPSGASKSSSGASSHVPLYSINT